MSGLFWWVSLYDIAKKSRIVPWRNLKGCLEENVGACQKHPPPSTQFLGKQSPGVHFCPPPVFPAPHTPEPLLLLKQWPKEKLQVGKMADKGQISPSAPRSLRQESSGVLSFALLPAIYPSVGECLSPTEINGNKQKPSEGPSRTSCSLCV